METPESQQPTLQISLAQLAALFDLIYPAAEDEAECGAERRTSGRPPSAGPLYARHLVDRALSAADNFLALNPEADAEAYYEVAARVFEGPRLTEETP